MKMAQYSNSDLFTEACKKVIASKIVLDIGAGFTHNEFLSQLFI